MRKRVLGDVMGDVHCIDMALILRTLALYNSCLTFNCSCSCSCNTMRYQKLNGQGGT